MASEFDDTPYNSDHYLLSISLLHERPLNIYLRLFLHDTLLEVSHDGKRFSHALNCTLTKTDGHLTECTVTPNVSRALNAVFDCETLSKTLHITSPDS